MSLAENLFDITVHCFIELFREGEGEGETLIALSLVSHSLMHTQGPIYTDYWPSVPHSISVSMDQSGGCIFVLQDKSVCFETRPFFWVFF